MGKFPQIWKWLQWGSGLYFIGRRGMGISIIMGICHGFSNSLRKRGKRIDVFDIFGVKQHKKRA